MIKYYTVHDNKNERRRVLAVICNSCRETIFEEADALSIRHLEHCHKQQLEDMLCFTCKKRGCV